MSFAEDEPQELPGGRTAEVTIPPQKLRRIMNSDETHHRLSNEGDRGGSRATTWVDKSLGRSGRRKVAATQGHVTGLYTCLADGQNGPPFYFFQSDAENSESYKIDARWVVGLPRVRFEQPDGTIVIIPAGTIVTPKGGMNGESFEKWLNMCVYPLFPDLAPDWEYDEDGNVVAGPVVLKIDGGPGRLGPASHGWRTRAAARGLYTFPGLQNATSVNQEMDDLYGCFQQTCTDVTAEIVAERVAARALEDEEGLIPVKKRTKVNLTNCDIGRIVCGREGDPIEECAFQRSFTKEKVLSSFAKVGAAPLTRAGLEQKKVRHETTEGDPGAGALVALETQHAANLTALAQQGANASVFRASLPRRELIERPTGEAAQFAALVESGVTHTTVWHTMGAAAHNCDTIVAAEAVKMLAERAATDAAEATQQINLRLLQGQAVAAELRRQSASTTTRITTTSRRARSS